MTLLFRHERITMGRQIWNMDETAVKAREIILNSRSTVLGPCGLHKPELIVPDVGSAAASCTAAFTVAASGDVCPPFLVVEGATEGHAYVRIQRADGTVKETIPLASLLQDGAVVMRRSPSGFTKEVFDNYARHMASFAMRLFPGESKVLALDGAKVHLSPLGLRLLLEAGVHVIIEPSKMSHLLQALDSPSAFGRFQPALRAAVVRRAGKCVRERRAFSVVDLVECVGSASDSAFTRGSLKDAFRRVGMWPLDCTRVRIEELSKGADSPVPADTDVPRLMRLCIPAVSKDIKVATVVNGTLSTAGRATLANAPQVLETLETLEAERVAKAKEAEKAKEEREKRAAERAVEKEQERTAVAARKAAAAKRRETARVEARVKDIARKWAVVAAATVDEARHMLRRLQPGVAKTRRRQQAQRQKQRMAARASLDPVTAHSPPPRLGPASKD